MANTAEQQALLKLRDQIDEKDRAILQLLSERAQLAEQVAEVKQSHLNPGEELIFYRPEREAQVLRKVQDLNPGPLDDHMVATLFREIMSACLALENPQKVAYLGPKGTFSYDATVKQFGQFAQMQPEQSIEDVFKAVSKGDVKYGVVPVENSNEGAVHRTFDCLQTSKLNIIGEVELAIHHNLLSKCDSLQEIEIVFAHEQALAQCKEWLAKHLPNAKLAAEASNGIAAQKAQTHPNSAAIASKNASEIYDLTILESTIQDSADNTTRFLVLSQQSTMSSGHDKTAMVFSTPNTPGALNNVLQVFADEQISMTRIVSRPSATATWDYVFFVDVIGHISEQPLKGVLPKLQACTSMLKILGSYPQSPL